MKDTVMLRRLSAIFVFLLLFSLLAGAFHHHHDGKEHHDCPICMAVVHHKADTGDTFALPEVQIELTGTVHYYSIISVVYRCFYTPSLGRAPPGRTPRPQSPELI